LWWDNKENNEFNLQKFCWDNSKKIKQATKSRTNWLALNALLGPSRRRKRRICRDPTPSDIPSDSNTALAVPFADDAIEKEEPNADCVLCIGRFSEDHSG